MQETWVQSLGQEGPLEKKVATHSTIPAWEIPQTEEPQRAWTIRSQKSLTKLRDQATKTMQYFVLTSKTWNLCLWLLKSNLENVVIKHVKFQISPSLALNHKKSQSTRITYITLGAIRDWRKV